MIDVEIEIIQADTTHISEILELWKEFMDFHKDIDPLFVRSTDGHLSMREHIQDLITSETAQVLVALDKNRVVAYAIAEIQTRPPVFKYRTFGAISDLAVMSEYRRKGIGEKMLQKMIEWFELHDMDRIELRVASENEIGYNFWRKHGFRDYMHVLRAYRRKEPKL